jgi:hypothetical protein
LVNSIWSEGTGDRGPLPAPNVVVARAGTPVHELSPAAVKGMLVNPVYTGVDPFPRMLDEESWVRACTKLIAEDGAEQFLVNLLFVLRECLPADTGRE